MTCTCRILRVVISIAALFASLTARAADYPTAAVAADHALASQAGVEILEAGGNAVDAAVATGFALSVTRPFSCGIGGGGFMVIYLPDDPTHGSIRTAINYRETAPGAITADTFVNRDSQDSRFGGLAVGTPGTVAGLLFALERYGTLEREAVLAPAIRIAEAGYERDAYHRGADKQIGVRNIRVDFRRQARALRLIAAEGRAGFYEGAVADAVVRVARRAGGVLTHADLTSYRVEEVDPLASTFRGRTVLGMPPPSSGGIAIAQCLGFLDRVTPDGNPFADPVAAHALVEAMKHAFADRAAYLGDPAFAEIPTALLMGGPHMDEAAGRFDARRTRPPEAYGIAAPLPGDGGTSHFSVVDRSGGAVACTETINGTYGSTVYVDEFGFVLNNEMDDFTTKPGASNMFGLVQSMNNVPEAGKRPVSSMSPTIVVDADGDVEIVAGASGGPRIISGTLQAMLRVLVEDADAEAAVDAPRVHHQWLPDRVTAEHNLPHAIADGLRSRGHEVVDARNGSVVQLIRRTGEGWSAASDRRKGGEAAGY